VSASDDLNLSLDEAFALLIRVNASENLNLSVEEMTALIFTLYVRADDTLNISLTAELVAALKKRGLAIFGLNNNPMWI
jgi:hypothetical protein